MVDEDLNIIESDSEEEEAEDEDTKIGEYVSFL